MTASATEIGVSIDELARLVAPHPPDRVGVALDTLQQIESHLLMRHYDEIMKKGRVRGRR